MLARADFILKLTKYFIKHQDRISCRIFPCDITLTKIRKVVKHQEDDKKYTYLTISPNMDAKDW